ncbi:MAG TPA: PDZ domain-containing protein [Lacipirellulaceae bacterium]
MSHNYLRGAVGLVLAIAAAIGTAALVQAQEDEAQNEGRVVQIGRADEESEKSGRNANGERNGGLVEEQDVPRYWIGLLGGAIPDDHPLRAHLDLPADQGLLVADVVPNSPASKAGLKKHDILLKANDTVLKEMGDLVELVSTEGEKKGQISLEVFRGGERETVYVKPEGRPADAQVSTGGFGEGGFQGGAGLPEEFQDLFGQLQRGQKPFNFRNFGPGVIVGQPGMMNVPNGVSVSITKKAGQPTEITVKRGEETWKVVGDDPQSLEQLPDDLRPFVERMLHGGAPVTFDPQMPNMEQLERRGFGDDRLSERLEEMERRMEELQRRLLGPNDQNADQPEAEETDQQEAN